MQILKFARMIRLTEKTKLKTYAETESMYQSIVRLRYKYRWGA